MFKIKVTALSSPSLLSSFLLILLFPLLSIFAGVGYFSLLQLEEQAEKRLQEDIHLISRAIQGSLEYALEHAQEDNVDKILASVFRFGRVYGAYIYDEGGREITTSGPQKPELEQQTLANMAELGGRKGEYQKEGGQEVYSYFVPLSDSLDQNLGLLQITRNRADFDQYLNRLRWQGLGVLVVLATLLLLVLVNGHYWVVGRHLSLLSLGMARIESGESDHRVFPSGAKELRQLAYSINTMLDSLASSEREVEDKRQQQIQLERELQQSQKMAAIGQLAAGVAHELGTPLSVVSGKAQRMLRKKDDLPHPVSQAFQEIRIAVQRMEHIVHQLLDFGRSNPLRRRHLNLAELAKCSLAHITEEAEQNGIRIKQASPSIPIYYAFDLVRMEQALVNLLRNALQAVEPGGLIELGWFHTETTVGFYVADDGEGIEESLYPRLFEPFYTTKAVGDGTGLGLSVVQAAVRDHGGQLNVGRSVYGGALFTLSFTLNNTNEEQA